MLTKVVATGLSLTALTAAMGLVALSVANRAIVEDVPFGKEIRCFMGLGDDCLREKLVEMRAEFDALNEQMDQRIKEANALTDPEAIQAHARTSGQWYVIVSSFYDDPIRQIGVQFSVCHLARDMGGPDDDLLIARLQNGATTSAQTDPRRLDDLNLSFGDVENARQICPWPS